LERDPTCAYKDKQLPYDHLQLANTPLGWAVSSPWSALSFVFVVVVSMKTLKLPENQVLGKILQLKE
jgi:hypothetical protein